MRRWQTMTDSIIRTKHSALPFKLADDAVNVGVCRTPMSDETPTVLSMPSASTPVCHICLRSGQEGATTSKPFIGKAASMHLGINSAPWVEECILRTQLHAVLGGFNRKENNAATFPVLVYVGRTFSLRKKTCTPTRSWWETVTLTLVLAIASTRFGV